MGQRYSQISFAERRRIQDLRDAQVPVAAIAEELGRHRSTIHREIRTPRRCPDYRTPAEVFGANLAALAASTQVESPERSLPRPVAPVGLQA